MTVSAQTPINRSTGNGVTTVFPYTFKIISSADIEVTVDDVVKTLNVDYTVTGAGVDLGGNVTMTTAPANGTSVVRRRNMALTRTTDYQDQGELPAATLDDDIDATVLMIQQVDEQTSRAMLLPIDVVGFSAELPTPVANYFLRVNSAGTALELAAEMTPGALTVTPFIETLLNDSTAADARTTLGAQVAGSYQPAGSYVTTSDIIDVAHGGTGGATANAARANLLQLPPVRQTVLSGPVDSAGLPSFGGSTGSTTVTATGTLTATAANGVSGDYIGSIANPSWTSLSTNGTMYLYLDIAAAGTCTTGSTTLAPTYRWGGADVVTSNQFTFNIQEMVGKVGNGAAAAQTYRVFVGEVTVSGGVVSAIVWYALLGRYRSAETATLPSTSTQVSSNHNIGVKPGQLRFVTRCTTIDNGYQVGDEVDNWGCRDSGPVYSVVSPVADAKAMSISTTNNAPFTRTPKAGGATFSATLASWAYRFEAQRGW